MESSNGMSQGAESISQPDISSQAQGQAQTAPVSAPEERTFKQSELNEIVKRAKYGAVEDYKRLQSEQPQYASQKHGDNASQTPQNQQFQPSNVPQESDIRRLAAEEANNYYSKLVQEARNSEDQQNAKRIADNYMAKVSAGKGKYADFDSVVGDPRSYGRFPNVVGILGTQVENAADVLYEMAKNPYKLVELENMARDYPDIAIKQAQRLSDSIRDNETAGKIKLPNEPLSQMRPSNTGTDNGVMGVKDYRLKYKV
jgi:hypothetical protein